MMPRANQATVRTCVLLRYFRPKTVLPSLIVSRT